MRSPAASERDFAKAKSAGASFAFIKASQALYLDPDFVLNWQNAGTSGILRGTYHFLDFKNKPSNKTANQWAIDRGLLLGRGQEPAIEFPAGLRL